MDFDSILDPCNLPNIPFYSEIPLIKNSSKANAFFPFSIWSEDLFDRSNPLTLALECAPRVRSQHQFVSEVSRFENKNKQRNGKNPILWEKSIFGKIVIFKVIITYYRMFLLIIVIQKLLRINWLRNVVFLPECELPHS